jgi:hypothetical protein
MTKIKLNSSHLYIESSLSKENYKKYFNPQMPSIRTKNKNKWSTESSTLLKIRRKPYKIYKNTKSISKKICISLKNITKKLINK